jgi:chromosome segregation protein
MRLEKIKLAGFKSFVDPTIVPLPGNLVGIVGPNGCGKSNIIDAVRWVMGESSAKHLRGGTMADVIFNGSSTRKPVGLASVELVFDNSEGRAPGEFTQYPEISIKRQVSRDGQSVYWLNGTRCRRKDITDLFLGTGLGARSYAIIEQGMISRLIEAKPEELREVIEEAAGISKYKDRRHETEQRMSYTRENLERLKDLCDEVAKQLASLQKQAQKAEKFIALKEEEQRYKEQLLAMRWRKYDELLRNHQSKLAEFEQIYRQLVGMDRDLSAALEQCQNRHEKLQRELTVQQGHYYELGAEINRLDQTIQHAQKTCERLQQELVRLQEERRQLHDDLENDQQQLEQTQEAFINTERALQEALAEERAGMAIMESKDQSLAKAVRAGETIDREMTQLQGQAELQRERLKPLQQQTRQFEIRRERLEHEWTELQETLEAEVIETLQQALIATETERTAFHEQLQNLREFIQSERGRAQVCQDKLHAQRSELQIIQGKMSSLDILQQHAMGKDQAGLNQWLTEHELHQTGRLAEYLDVDPGWEAAVENVLGLHLEALCVESAAPYLSEIDGFLQDSLAFFETADSTRSSVLSSNEESHGVNQPNGTLKLVDRIGAPWNLGPLLGHVYCADHLMAAKEISGRLAAHESVVTAAGFRVGPNWVAIHQPKDGKSGVIKREKQLKELKSTRDQLFEQGGALEHELAEAEAAFKRAEQEREAAQLDERRLASEQSRIQAELSAAKARHEQALKRWRQLEFEREDLDEQHTENVEQVAEAEVLLQEAEIRLVELQPEARDLSEQRKESELQLHEAEASLRMLRERVHELKSRQESLKATEILTRKNLDRAQTQYDHAFVRMEGVSAQITEALAPLEDEQALLVERLEQRVQVERGLVDLRKRSAEMEAEMRRLNEEKLRKQHELDELKQRLEQIKLELQANEVRRQTVQEQCEEIGVEPTSIAASLPEQADEKTWQKRVSELGEEMARLGAVNLTAREEYQIQEERMSFLNQQHLDLTEALKTLQEAIEKIDRECRSRFKNTFDQVNAGLQRMFPKLFGGGQATLELIDRNLLESGVSVMARPPGKRNSSIHLLSGGEKALTAVALVFSIFELNPAPFCLLDEVDAPLDDANVGRFSQLVKEMSEKVQFLFISHNKTTMEIAQHLAGVTMKEPGVSRIVAVDIDEAVELAAV